MTIQKRVWVAVMRKSEGVFEVLLGLRGPDCGNPYTWGLFGGGVDAGENVLAAGFREMEEETGVDLTGRSTGLGYVGKSSKVFGDKELHWFIYGGGDIKKKDCQLTAEVVEYKWVSLESSKSLTLHYSAAFFFQGLKEALDCTPYKAPVWNIADLNKYVL